MPEPVSESVFHFLSGTGRYPSFPAEISGSGLLSLSPAAWVQAYQRAEHAIGKRPDPGIVQNLEERTYRCRNMIAVGLRDVGQNEPLAEEWPAAETLEVGG